MELLNLRLGVSIGVKIDFCRAVRLSVDLSAFPILEIPIRSLKYSDSTKEHLPLIRREKMTTGMSILCVLLIEHMLISYSTQTHL